MSIKMHKVLKKGVSRFNPYIPEMPAAGDHLTVYQALANAFTSTGKVFEGSVDEVVEGLSQTGIPEHRVREGFRELEGYGMVEINGDRFKPTQQFVDKFF